MKPLSYEGYIGEVDFDDEDEVLHGRVINTRAVLTFEAETVAGLKAAFKDTIEDYRAWCAERGVEPERPYSGNLSLRLAPEMHRALAAAAAAAKQSINVFITETLSSRIRGSVGLPVAVGQVQTVWVPMSFPHLDVTRVSSASVAANINAPPPQGSPLRIEGSGARPTTSSVARILTETIQ